MGYVSDLLLATSIRPNRTVPDPRNISSLTLKLSGINDPALIIPSFRQKFTQLDSQTYYLKITTRSKESILPRKIPLLEPDFKDYLKATAYIQSGHPSIRILAKEIAGPEKDGLRVSERLVKWVYTNLDKSFLAAIPNAVDVLKKRSGDCKAHAVLFTALARSLGLPARLVSGVVETDDGAFYYHQWAEVYTGQWIPVDPVFGTVPVDATHIKLSQGDLSEQLHLLNAIGALSIEILDYEMEEVEK
jgi:transglutaminase-like putative cysteine protease